PRPRPALSAATVFAVDEFTPDNGATVAIPASHLWGEERFPRDSDERVMAVMPAGSCILFLGNLWHGGGANYSGASRLAITAQYCEPWVRTQENYFLSVSRETAASVSENIRRLLGYSIHPPFMGMCEGMHPKRKLPLDED
ncbi:MAG: phytanoyl-CoA dioxygenase family protein, partial [Halioglobus sp.]|nr:phytanoyl-CoA dioxygenase family protein [Halioglobus sp.]